MIEKLSIEETDRLALRFDAAGLVTVVVEDADTSETLMLAHANDEAVQRTLDTGLAYFWSRSRRELWCKGATSGNTLAVIDVRVDCDQDALLYRVRVQGDGVACHTGRRSCFYRSVRSSGTLTGTGSSSE